MRPWDGSPFVNELQRMVVNAEVNAGILRQEIADERAAEAEMDESE